MRSLPRLLAVLVFTSTACGDDEVARSDVETIASAEVAEVDASPEVTLACPIAGTWNLQNVLCGDNDITADWFRVIDRTTAVLSTSGTGCALTTTNETDACTEEERGTLVTKSGSQWAVVSQGIIACTPAACTFGGQDAACALADRAATYDATITLAAGRLSLTSSNGICVTSGAGASTTFVFEAR